jgi:PAS domain-containing protein
MDQVIDFFKGLFSTNLWPARWHCGLWSDFHGWLYIISDLMIWAAYFAMPIIIIAYISRRKGTKFYNIYYLFAAFILACGTTHLLDAITFWYPMYRLSALVRFFTGIISWVTVFALVKMLPIAFALKPAELLEAEVEQRKHVEEELQHSLALLNSAQEIARMGHWEWDVTKQKVQWSDGLFKLYEMPVAKEGLSYEESFSYIYADDRANVQDFLHEAVQTKVFKEYYYRILTPKGIPRPSISEARY